MAWGHRRSDDPDPLPESPTYLCHSVFQDSATPERKRFFVRRNPSGEMEIVYGSPSISISRRMVFSSLVDMIPRHYPAPLWGFGYASTFRFLASAVPSCQYVVDEPLSLLLTNERFSNHSSLLEHVVRGLQHALQMRRIALRQRQLLAQAVQPYSPCKHVLSPGDLYEAVESTANG